MGLDAGLSKGLGLAGAVVGSVAVLLILSVLAPTLFAAVADTNEVLGNDSITTGDASADAIKPVFGIIIGLSAVFGLVGVVLAAVGAIGRD